MSDEKEESVELFVQNREKWREGDIDIYIFLPKGDWQPQSFSIGSREYKESSLLGQ